MESKSARPPVVAAALAALAAAVNSASAQNAAIQPVEAVSLSRDAFATGSLTPATGALPETLWDDADPDALSLLIDSAPGRPASASVGAVMRRLLLSPGRTPLGASPSLGGKKLLALASAGFTEEARTIASLSDAAKTDPHVGQSLAVADLLDAKTADACNRSRALIRGKDSPFWVKLRVFCAAIAKEYDAADLTLGILREQGLLDETENALLTAISAPSPLKLPVAPRNALELAILRQIGGPIAPAVLDVGDGGVLKSLARDASLDPRTRIVAANRAAAMGVIGAASLRAIYGSFAFDGAALAGNITVDPNDPLSDAAVYQSIARTAGPEFVRDNAARIASALIAAPTHARAFAASVVYADEIEAFDGLIVSPAEAGAFAMARMAVGDPDRARNWLTSMLGQGLSTLDEETALSFIELTNLLAVLDPAAGGALAAAANVSIAAPRGQAEAIARAAPVEDRFALAELVDAAIDAAARGIEGQAALAGLALTRAAYRGDPVAATVAARAFEAGGLTAVVRQRAFEGAWSASFPETSGAALGTGEAAGDGEAGPPPSPRDGLTPSLKPKRD